MALDVPEPRAIEQHPVAPFACRVASAETVKPPHPRVRGLGVRFLSRDWRSDDLAMITACIHPPDAMAAPLAMTTALSMTAPVDFMCCLFSALTQRTACVLGTVGLSQPSQWKVAGSHGLQESLQSK